MPEDPYKGIAQFFDLFEAKENIPFYSIVAEDYNTVVDVGSGTGQIAIPLAMEGKQVIAVEPSHSMISIFEEKLQYHDISRYITIKQASADTFQIQKSADIIIMSDVVNELISKEIRIQSFSHLNSSLSPEGRLVLDARLVDDKEHYTENVEKVKVEDVEYQKIRNTSEQGNILEHNYTYQIVDEDQQVLEKYQTKIQSAKLSKQEVVKTLKQTEFEIEALYSDYHFTEYDNGEDLLVVIAKPKS